MKVLTTAVQTFRKYKALIILLKVVFAILLGLLIYHEIFVKRDFNSLLEVFRNSLTKPRLFLLGLVVILMPLNWLLESLKWKIIVEKFSPLSILEAMKIIVVGLTFGILTPSRLGEYAGRFYMMKKGCKWSALSATFVGSLAQNIITGTVGIVSAMFLLTSNSVLDKYIVSSLIYVILFLVFLGLLIFYNVGFFHSLLDKFSSFGLIGKLIEKGEFLEHLTTFDLNMVLLSSLGRYIIYTTQYLLLLTCFGIDFGLIEACCVIGLVFLIQSGIPLPPILGVMARGELAITIWSLYTYNTLGIIATTFLLWFINLIIPVIVGLILILSKKEQ